jgi:ATP-binding cassette subfamily G (WHITE) protein 2 (SNQ2)
MEVEECVTFRHSNQFHLFLLYVLRSIIKAHQKTLTWENLNYHVPGPNGPIRLLHDVFGYVKPGTLTALMGASGAGAFVFSPILLRILTCTFLLGKTTCLDVLAQRKNIGVVSGDVLVDGRGLSSDFARATAYGG